MCRCTNYIGCDFAIEAVGVDGCLLMVGGATVRVPAWRIDRGQVSGPLLSDAEMVGGSPLKVKRGRYSLWFRHRVGSLEAEVTTELKVFIGADRSTGAACYYMMGMLNHRVGQQRFRRFSASAEKEGIKANIVDAVDGNKAKQRPSCLPEGHIGYIGMWLSMMKIWKRALQRCPHDWIVTFEDDGVVPTGFAKNFERFISAHPHLQIVWLDERNSNTNDRLPEAIGSKSRFAQFISARLQPSGCCTVSMAYERTGMLKLIEEFDLSNPNAFWNGYEGRDKAMSHSLTPEEKANKAKNWRHYECLTDLYLGNVVVQFHIAAGSYSLVQHDNKAESLITAVTHSDLPTMPASEGDNNGTAITTKVEAAEVEAALTAERAKLSNS